MNCKLVILMAALAALAFAAGVESADASSQEAFDDELAAPGLEEQQHQASLVAAHHLMIAEVRRLLARLEAAQAVETHARLSAPAAYLKAKRRLYTPRGGSK